MASAIAGEVLGPRPGRAIVSFWQGGVEIGLRAAAALFGALPALIAAALALGTARDDDVSDAIESLNQTGEADDLEDLRDETYATTGFVIGIAGLAIIFEILMIVIRFCNIGAINLKIVIFLIIDIILSIIFAVGLAAGGVALDVFAPDWDDYFGGLRGDPIDAERIHDSMAASAAFCFVGFILFIVLAIWMIIFAAKKWNNEVVKYTLKDAITP